MGKSFSRREFLQSSMAAAALAGLSGRPSYATEEPSPGTMPTRILGKTGVRVPLLGMGTAQPGVALSVEEGAKLYERALEMGINFFDSAPEFAGYGKAQLQLGHAFKGRRKEVFLTTKCARNKADEAMKLLESNLKEMQTDHTDLVYVHSLGADDRDMSVVTGPGGVMEFLEKAKREGLAKFVGVTGHNRPDRFIHILKDYDLDVIMTAVNFVDRNTYNFEEKIWPVAAEKQVALVAMKLFGGSQNNNENRSRLATEHHKLALRYGLGLPRISCAVVGMKSAEELTRNVEWVKQYQPLNEQELAEVDKLGKTLAGEWKDHLGKIV